MIVVWGIKRAKKFSLADGIFKSVGKEIKLISGLKFLLVCVPLIFTGTIFLISEVEFLCLCGVCKHSLVLIGLKKSITIRTLTARLKLGANEPCPPSTWLVRGGFEFLVYGLYWAQVLLKYVCLEKIVMLIIIGSHAGSETGMHVYFWAALENFSHISFILLMKNKYKCQLIPYWLLSVYWLILRKTFHLFVQSWF